MFVAAVVCMRRICGHPALMFYIVKDTKTGLGMGSNNAPEISNSESGLRKYGILVRATFGQYSERPGT
ncbi:hypothetical protein Plhal304r1_c006g0024141 [Plasmopara halstedii]